MILELADFIAYGGYAITFLVSGWAPSFYFLKFKQGMENIS